MQEPQENGTGRVETAAAARHANGGDQPEANRRRVTPRHVVVPPEPFDPLRTLSSLLVAVAVCAPVLFVGLGRGDVNDDREAEALLRSRETWRLIHQGESSAWLIPRRNGFESVDRGPMPVWVHLASWADLDPDTATEDELVERARLASAIMAVITLIATYWSAVSIGGVRTGRLTTMALGTTLLFPFICRTASPQVITTAWVMLATAAGLWSIRPLKQMSGMGRRVLGWPLAGVALGGAILSGGAPPLLLVLTPLLSAILMTPKRRADNLFGVLFAVLLGAMVSMPWHLYVLGRVVDSWGQIVGGVFAWGDEPERNWAWWRWVIMLSPWQVWLLGGLLQPFLRAGSEARRQLLIGWVWLGVVTAAMIGGRDDRHVLAALPAAALLTGQLWSFHAQLASERRDDPGVNLLRVPHWVLMIAVSIAGPLFIAIQPMLIDQGRLEREEMPGFMWMSAAGLGVALLGLALLGTRWHWKWRPRLAAYATPVWMSVAMTVGMLSYSASYHEQYDLRPSAERAALATRGRALLQLVSGPDQAGPEPAFLFYLGRSVRAVMPERLEQALSDQPEACILVRADRADDAALATLGIEPLGIGAFRMGADGPYRLFQTPDRGDATE